MRLLAILTTLFPLLLAAEDAAPSVPASVTPAERLSEGWWKERHEAKTDLARKGGYDLVFLGDSITHGWENQGKDVWKQYYEPRRALNLGFSGDRTEHVLWRLSHGELEKVHPKLFVIMIGTNNTGRGNSPEETAQGITRIVEQLREQRPEAKILLLAVFPRSEAPDDKYRLANVELNRMIKPLADEKSVYWLDLTKTFLQEDGVLPKEIMPDALHPNARGYELWAKAAEPKIAELTGTPEVK